MTKRLEIYSNSTLTAQYSRQSIIIDTTATWKNSAIEFSSTDNVLLSEKNRNGRGHKVDSKT